MLVGKQPDNNRLKNFADHEPITSMSRHEAVFFLGGGDIDQCIGPDAYCVGAEWWGNVCVQSIRLCLWEDADFANDCISSTERKKKIIRG